MACCRLGTRYAHRSMASTIPLMTSKGSALRRWVQLQTKRGNRRGSASGDNLAALCTSHAENFTQLPVQRVEQAVKPTQQQQDALEKLKSASTEAANQLQASCPAQSPQTPIDRFDAVGKRLNAMAGAIKTVRLALADFYSSFHR